jgi:hypothetical protein
MRHIPPLQVADGVAAERTEMVGAQTLRVINFFISGGYFISRADRVNTCSKRVKAARADLTLPLRADWRPFIRGVGPRDTPVKIRRHLMFALA